MTDATAVFEAVAGAAPAVRDAARGATERTGGTNPTGDRRRTADVAADEALLDALRDCPAVGRYHSEERDAAIDVGAGHAVAVDPLDGSSNLASNNPVGTVVGVYDEPLPAPGSALVAACAVLYGPETTMLTTTGGTTHRRRVVDGVPGDPDPVSLPPDPVVAGVGGRRSEWPGPVADAVEARCASLKTRYCGCLVADVAQVLAHGGVFVYPPLVDAPRGKLRYLYEAAPMALLVEGAGGRAEDESGRLLDAGPGDLHARTPIAAGDPGLASEFGSSFPRKN